MQNADFGEEAFGSMFIEAKDFVRKVVLLARAIITIVAVAKVAEGVSKLSKLSSSSSGPALRHVCLPREFLCIFLRCLNDLNEHLYVDPRRCLRGMKESFR